MENDDSMTNIMNTNYSCIVVNSQIQREFVQHGPLYYAEAKRIVTHIPKFPSKYDSNWKGGG
jgi:uncharacterized membrane protein YjjP (DUF1212 family)